MKQRGLWDPALTAARATDPASSHAAAAGVSDAGPGAARGRAGMPGDWTAGGDVVGGGMRPVERQHSKSSFRHAFSGG